MSTIITIPPKSQFLQPSLRFSAAFNVPTVNKYDFAVAGNTRIDFLKMKKQYLYLFDAFSFSASMLEGVFLKSVDTAAGKPSTLLSFTIPSQDDRIIYPNKIPLINYIDNSPVQYYAYAEQDDILQATFEGTLSQPIELAGEATIFSQIQANVYEIRNRDWIDVFLGSVEKNRYKNILGV